MDDFPQGSIGLVEPQTRHFDKPLLLANGRVLPTYQLIHETYGALNANQSNAVLICHALSGDHHPSGFYLDEVKQPARRNCHV